VTTDRRLLPRAGLEVVGDDWPTKPVRDLVDRGGGRCRVYRQDRVEPD
jgi:hypothetical protein